MDHDAPSPTTPSSLPSPRKYCYRQSTSSSSSSCSISHLALSCNFLDLAEKYPEFRYALAELRCRRRSSRRRQAGQSEKKAAPQSSERVVGGGPVAVQQREAAQAAARHDDDRDDGPPPSPPDPHAALASSPSHFSARITHAFNASLARALLRHHFRLELPSLPAGRLCPPIPNRANYVCWLRELLSRSEKDLHRFSAAASAAEADGGGGVVVWQCRGMDIGTGVSAIYPLLLTTNLFVDDPTNSEATHENEPPSKQWKFLATDIDPLAIESACINVRTNRLEDRIHVVQVGDDANSSTAAKNGRSGPLFAAMEAAKHTALRPIGLEDHHQSGAYYRKELAQYPKFDFVMTNPPFYKTLKEATSPRAGDKRPRTDMSSGESLYARVPYDVGGDMDDDEDCDSGGGGGGDVGFITAIIDDSRHFRHHVTWYTSLVSKKSSLEAIQHKLQTLDGVWGNRGQIRTVEFRQENLEGSEISEGSHNTSTRVRWGIGWTYERAMGRCSACRVGEGLQSFEVWVGVGDADDKTRKACEEVVVSRLITYFENVQDISLKCSQRVRECSNVMLPGGSNDGSGRRSCQDRLMRCVTVVEERFYNLSSPAGLPPAKCLPASHDNSNLPIEGHMLIDAFVGSSGKCNASGCVSVQVVLDMYSHTKHGSAIINTLQCQLPDGNVLAGMRREILVGNVLDH